MTAPPAPPSFPSSIEAPELRRLALASAAALDDGTVEQALRSGTIWIRHTIATWESSEGTTLGHLVGLSLDAALLARIAPEPPVVDALTVAIAEAIAQRPLESLRELRIHWDGAIRSEGPYRGDALRTGLAEALDAYLKERGEENAARALGSAKFDIVSRLSDIVATVHVPREVVAREHDFREITDAFRFLLAGPEGTRVRTHIRIGRP
ncbi:hypothetical protein [Pendulispora albinea]|uniref:Uncharacterized protein n=1 Tax=Pendulispora albinea TaxID=2741071 RepID=A0ABZ2LVX8_9BACT